MHRFSTVRKTFVGVLLLFGVTVALVSCTQGSDSTQDFSGTKNNYGEPTVLASGEDDPLLKKYYQQTISWENCSKNDDFSSDSDLSSLECGFVTVPVVYPDLIQDDTRLGNDYVVEEGRPSEIKLAVSRSKAVGKKKGSLLLNPGGPGGSGLWLPAVLQQSAKSSGMKVSDSFDFVGFDPRGVGSSQPAVRCLDNADIDKGRADPYVRGTIRDVEVQEKFAKEFVDKCVSRMGTTFLAHLGTRDVVRDMDIIRSALGDKKLTYLGYSYGTFLGSNFAEVFPSKVRALVLDGVVDPSADSKESLIRQGEGFQKSFDEFARQCSRQSNCPLGTDPKKAVRRYHELVRPLIDQPATTRDERGLSYSDAVLGTTTAFYAEHLWPDLSQGLRELQRGRGDTLLKLADSYMDRDRDGSYSNTQDAFAAIGCMDRKRTTDKAEMLSTARQFLEVAPYNDPGGPLEAASMGSCPFWPVKTTMTPHTPNFGDAPRLLVISTTGDPATPYQAGVNLAKSTNSALLTVQGHTHGASFGSSRCTNSVVDLYLVDGKLPKDGMRCEDSRD